MASYTVAISWARGDAAFSDGKYSRAHVWRFDGGIEVPASSSPLVIRPPLSAEAAVDPEEAFVAALSSCHMLWFLALARKAGLVVDRYEDHAVGTMAKDPNGRMAITEVFLRPVVAFAGQAPTEGALRELHDRAHQECFIANSVKSEVRVEL
jgi:organic hydroperoxide reductase OsmC/OhrA